MISTDERSPSGRDNSTTRLNNNNNGENNSLYYQYVPASTVGRTTSGRSNSVTTLSSSPHQHPSSQIVLRDPRLSQSHPHIPHLDAGAVSSIINSSSVQQQQQYGITDFIQQHLSSRLIPKLGSIVKRFSLNYSGEGLLSDRQRTRTVRVGIRFQVQVDSFVNNRLQGQDRQPRAIVRTQSAPTVDQLDSGFSSPTADVFRNNRQLALEYCKDSRISSSNSSVSTAGGAVPEFCCGDSSSGSSSEGGSPVLSRKKKESSTTLAFHNRINQALHSYRSQLPAQGAGSPPSSGDFLNRRSSVQVYRRRSASPERISSIPEQLHQRQQQRSSNMEDSSSYQMLRHCPGSNVNSLNELSWETAAFEKEIRDRIQWFGEKISSIRIPRIIGQLAEVGKEYARENPVTALMFLALGLTSSAPVLLFLVFAIATILVTFLGFLFVEGTLLTVATVVLGGVIFVVGFGTLTAVLIGMLGYFTTSQAYMVVTGRSNIFNLLRKIPVIGRFFPEPSNIPESNESENLISKPEGHVVANGKVGNGHGPPHGNHSSNNHFDFDEDDILDTDEEIDDIEEENVLNSDSDLGEDEDLGNQENISGANKAENHTAAPAAAPAHHHNDTEEPVLMNGESSENKLVNGYGDSDDSENSEDLARDD